MPRIAFATYQHRPEMTLDDRRLADALERRGVEVESHPWDAPVDWTIFDAILPRSTWDFHLRLQEFWSWLDRVEATSTCLLNPPVVLRWTTTKRYLRELGSRGVPIVPTQWVTPRPHGGAPLLREITSTHGWTTGAVVKPVVSASAHDTWIACGADEATEQSRFASALNVAPLGIMVQPLLPEITEKGEWSLVFIAGAFSHAVLKRATAGDFRVQHDFGGTVATVSPPQALIDGATHLLAVAAERVMLAPADWLYARIDGIERDGRLLLMELEAVEPVLFLANSPTAADRLASAVVARLARRTLPVEMSPSSEKGDAS